MNDQHENDVLWRKPEVMARTTLSNSTLRRMEIAGTFPKRVQIGSGVAWRASEVVGWMRSRPVGEIRPESRIGNHQRARARKSGAGRESVARDG